MLVDSPGLVPADGVSSMNELSGTAADMSEGANRFRHVMKL